MKKRSILAAVGLLALTATTGAVYGEGIIGRLGFLLGGNPIVSSAGSIAQGREVFSEYCAACHGDNGDGRGPLAADLTTAPASFAALNRPPSVLAMRIHYGVGQDMPAWKDTLEDETIWHIVNYINTLARNGAGRADRQWWQPGRS